MSKILVIEDDKKLRELMCETLTEHEYEVRSARNGAMGLQLLEEASVDLVISDIFMPEKDGLEVIREIRTVSPDMKIIAVSGGGRLGKETYLMAAKRMGANHVLGKPFNLQEFIDLVREALS